MDLNQEHSYTFDTGVKDLNQEHSYTFDTGVMDLNQDHSYTFDTGHGFSLASYHYLGNRGAVLDLPESF